MPVLINARTTPTWRSLPNTVLVDRTTKWGNRFKIGVDGDRNAVIKKHKEWFKKQLHLIRCLHELEGKNLVCWCHPLPCHALLYLRLANPNDNIDPIMQSLWHDSKKVGISTLK